MRRTCILAFVLAFSACAGSAKKSDNVQATAAPTGATKYQGLGASSVAPETVAKFTAPPLDPNLASRIQMMFDIRSPGMGMPTEDGKKLFYGWSVSGTPQVWRLDGPKSFPVQMTGGSDSTGLQGITPDGRYLILSRDHAGEENPGLFLQDPNGGSLKEIFHKTGMRAALNQIAPDGNTIYYSANDQKPDSMAIYSYDIHNGTRKLVWGEPGLWHLADIRADGLMLLTKATGSLSSEWFTLDPQSKKLTPVIGQNENEEYDVAFSRTPNEFLVLTNKLGDFRRLYRFTGGELKAITPDKKMDVEEFQIDQLRYRVLVTWNDQGYSRIEAYDAKSYAPLSLPKLPTGSSTYWGRTTQNSRYTTVGVESGKAPRTSYVYDWQSKSLTQWVIPSAPEANLNSFAEEKLEFFPARDGTKIPMLVRRPKNCTAPCPVVVEFHGGPEGQSRPGFSPWAQMFVDAGFVFVEPNVRGSDGYGKTWLKSDDGPKRLQVVTDIEDVANYIRKNWKVNGKEPKIGVTGGSYGGYSTLYAMTRFAGAYDAGVEIVGMSNLLTFLQNTAPYRRALRISEYGDPDKDADALKQLSPITYLDRVKAPLLMIQGVSDPRVPVGEAIQMFEAMKAKGLDSQLILFPDEGHGSVKRENQVLQTGHTIAFFKRTLTEGPEVHSNH